MKRVKLRVRGRVQGVLFRESAREQAEALGLAGLARNEPNGTLYLEVEGPPSAVDVFVTFAREGPPQARVDRVDIEEAESAGLSGFRIE